MQCVVLRLINCPERLSLCLYVHLLLCDIVLNYGVYDRRSI